MITVSASTLGSFQNEVREFTIGLRRLCLQSRQQAAPKTDAIFSELAQAIRVMSRRCHQMQQRCEDPTQLKVVQEDFRRQVAPWFDTSWFMSHAKQKPRGYPGDFELLSAIYDGQPRSLGLGGYLDLYFLQSDLGRAVVARMKAAREFLNREISDRQGDLTILNVASGPCRELFTGLEVPADRQIDLYCIDYDAGALDFVRNELASNGSAGLPNLKFMQYNALRMRSAKTNVKKFGSADVIYSIGLLDYLPDKQLVATLRGLRETLRPGGVAYLAFKDVNGYDPCEYQWFVDWFFFERDERQCRELLCAAGFSDNQLSMSRDETKIIMNFAAHAGKRVPHRFNERVQTKPIRTL